MGLDLRHYHVTDAISGEFFVIDDACRAVAEKHCCLLVELNVDANGTPSNDEKHKVLYVREVGYQRKGMTLGFYERFAPDLVAADRRIVEAMHDLAEADSAAHFKAFFLDNWDDDCSIVVVSW